MPEIIDYQQVSQHIKQYNIEESASGLHGVLCGLCCASEAVVYLDLIKAVVTTNHQQFAKDELLKQWFVLSKNQLASDDFSFDLFIDDNCALGGQVEQMVDWCNGFLLGLGLGKIKQTDKQTQEAIQDIANIARFCDVVTDNQANQNDFYNTLEHIKIATLLIYQENINAILKK